MAPLALSLLVLALALVSGSHCARPAQPDSAVEINRLVYFLVQQEEHASLASHLIQKKFTSRMYKTLSAVSDITILAPTEEAVSRWNSTGCRGQALEDSLDNHILVGRYLGESLQNGAVGTQYPLSTGLMIAKASSTPFQLKLVTSNSSEPQSQAESKTQSQAMSQAESQSKSESQPKYQPEVQVLSATVTRMNVHVTRRVVVHSVDSILSPECKESPRLSEIPVAKAQGMPLKELAQGHSVM